MSMHNQQLKERIMKHFPNVEEDVIDKLVAYTLTEQDEEVYSEYENFLKSNNMYKHTLPDRYASISNIKKVRPVEESYNIETYNSGFGSIFVSAILDTGISVSDIEDFDINEPLALSKDNKVDGKTFCNMYNKIY